MGCFVPLRKGDEAATHHSKGGEGPPISVLEQIFGTQEGWGFLFLNQT